MFEKYRWCNEKDERFGIYESHIHVCPFGLKKLGTNYTGSHVE